MLTGYESHPSFFAVEDVQKKLDVRHWELWRASYDTVLNPESRARAEKNEMYIIREKENEAVFMRTLSRTSLLGFVQSPSCHCKSGKSKARFCFLVL